MDARKPWETVCFSNSDYAGDPVDRRNVSGFTLNVLPAPVFWQSKAQRSMMVLSSEAEWVACQGD